MKKSYKAPEVLVVELDAEQLCQAQVIIASRSMQSLNGEVVSDGATDTNGYNENQFSASYRTNLWGDN